MANTMNTREKNLEMASKNSVKFRSQEAVVLQKNDLVFSKPATIPSILYVNKHISRGSSLTSPYAQTRISVVSPGFVPSSSGAVPSRWQPCATKVSLTFAPGVPERFLKLTSVLGGFEGVGLGFFLVVF